MSLIALEGRGGTELTLYQPRYGQWRGDVLLDVPDELSGKVTLSVGDVSLVGTIESGGPSGGTARYLVVGGLAWSTRVAPADYRTEAATGVRLKTVLIDLARACGAYADGVDLPPDTRLGDSYSRLSGPAREALSRLASVGACPSWYMSNEGRTVFGERTGGAIDVPHRVRDPRVLTLGIRRVSSDTYAPWVPGATFEGARIDSVLTRITMRDSIIELRS